MNIEIDLPYPEVCYECPILHEYDDWHRYEHCVLYMPTHHETEAAEVYYSTELGRIAIRDEDTEYGILTYRRPSECRVDNDTPEDTRTLSGSQNGP